MVIYHQHEPRDLAAAYEKYCGKSLEDAHSSAADVRAAADIFEAQVRQYPELPVVMAELHEVCHPREPDWIDDQGRLIQSDQGPKIGFGRYIGRSLKDLAVEDPGYLQWILSQDFSTQVKDVIGGALREES